MTVGFKIKIIFFYFLLTVQLFGELPPPPFVSRIQIIPTDNSIQLLWDISDLYNEDYLEIHHHNLPITNETEDESNLIAFIKVVNSKWVYFPDNQGPHYFSLILFHRGQTFDLILPGFNSSIKPVFLEKNNLRIQNMETLSLIHI